MTLTVWLDALDSARARWKGATQAERVAITAELDAVWESLSEGDKVDATSEPPPPETPPVHCGPRFASLRALVTWDPLWQVRAFQRTLTDRPTV